MDKNQEIYEKEIFKTIKRYATKTKPEHELAKILESKSANKLREMAKLYRIPRYTVSNKDGLISDLKRILTNFESIEMILSMLKNNDLNQIISLSKVDVLECDVITASKLDFSAILGMVEIYYYEDKFIAVMPNEIKELVAKAYADDFKEKRKRENLILDYTKACINLYGFISEDEFIEIFNSQNKVKTDSEEVFSTIIKHTLYDESEFDYVDKYIASEGLEDDELDYLIEMTKGKPRYIPEKVQLLKYADQFYYEKTIYTKKVEQYIKTICKADDVEEVVEEICFLATMDEDLEEIIKFLGNSGVIFKNLDELDDFVSVAVELKNNTRIWENKGHTPIEINRLCMKNKKREYSAKFTPFDELVPTITKKVGRNEPCPCGSGKKYKKCCGR